jgi:hypothetical protein
MVIFAWSALVLVRRGVHGTSVVDGRLKNYRRPANKSPQEIFLRPASLPPSPVSDGTLGCL